MAFVREHRYEVIKIKHLTPEQHNKLAEFLSIHRIETIECVVIEKDWPEYEPVWAMLQERVERDDVDPDAPVPLNSE